jgi:hypothetical protein
MRARRDRVIRQVFITSLIVGAICFVGSFVLFLSIGINVGLIKLHLFATTRYSTDWSEVFGWVIVWGGSFGIAILSTWLFLSYTKKFVPPK